MNTFRTFESREQLWNAVYRHVSGIKPHSHVALPGGSVLEIIPQMTARGIDWNMFCVHQTDERWVPNTHPDSNQRALVQCLPTGAHMHAFRTDEDRERALKRYEKELPAALDLVVLGCGPDGHVASIFPDTEPLFTTQKTAHTQTNQFAVRERLTLRLDYLKSADTVFLILLGEHKKEMYERIKTEANLPAAQVAQWPQTRVFWTT